MKKSLLLILTAAAGIGTATAGIKEPVIYPEASVQRISADGSVAVSEIYGTVKIFDLDKNTQVQYDATDDMTSYYSLGHGNCVSKDGSIILMNTCYSPLDAAYLENGKFFQLNVPDENKDNLTNGVTPDGSRICGSVGMHEMTFDEVIMQIPAYWDRNADGTYSECHILPYPTKDLMNETPQYVTAIAISDDGKTIVGQMVFSSGSMIIPVVYKEDEKGEWSYELPTKALFNPDGLEAVENPGDGPMPPSYEDYMTAEELEAYNAAINEYYQTFEGNYPEYEDFMTDEEKAAYTAAYQAYQSLYDEWEVKWNAYNEYYSGVIATSPSFVFNNCYLSTDGKSVVSTLEMEDPNADPWSWFKSNVYVPSSLDIATGVLTKVDTELSIAVSGVANNGVILAGNGQNETPMLGYVIKDGQVLTVTDFLKSVNPLFEEWILKNMSHEVAVDYDPETWEEIFEECVFTGMPAATPDMSVLSVWNNCPWDWEQSAESVIFNLNPVNSGIAAISTAAKDIKVVAKGVVSVPEGYSALNVYNLNGQCVKSLSNPCGLVKLNVAAGAYIVKGVRANGSASIVKLTAN